MPLRSAQSLERKFITVLFADMVGSLRTIQHYDPEDAHELLSASIALMTEGVHRYGGVVTRTMGDGILAAFGAPIALEDHAVRACSAALDIAREFGSTGARLAGVTIRIGLHSGEVVVGSATNDFAVEYEMTGAAVHIASRIQSAAPPGRALLTTEANELAGDAIETEFFQRIALSGLDEPLDTFLVVGSRVAARSRPSLPVRDLVGRDDDLARLAAALDDALAGHGRILGLAGEPGVGKTTLLGSLLQRQCRATRVLHVTAEHSTSVVPFHPFRNILLALFQPGGDGVDALAAALRSGLARLGLDNERCRTALHEIFELEYADPARPAQDRTRYRDLVSHAIADVLIAAAGHEPALVVIEDLQKTDSATLDALGVLGERLAGHRLAVVVTFRSDFAPPWAQSGFYQEMALASLPAHDADRLVSRLLGGMAPAPVVRKIAARSRGNPLFMSECVRTLQAALDGAGLKLDDTLSRIPPTVTAIIAERIDRLPAPAKETLLAASVLGEQFPAELLTTLCGGPGPELEASLDTLEQAGLLSGADPERMRLAFPHSLYQEVCYGMMLKRKRRALHRAAFASMHGQDFRLSAPVESLAQHAFHGELWPEAVNFCRQAGHRAAHRSSNREAAAHFESAIAALDQMETPLSVGVSDSRAGSWPLRDSRSSTIGYESRLRDAIDLRLELRSAYLALLRLDKVKSLLTECSALARSLGEAGRLTRVTAFEAGFAYMTGGARDSVAFCRHALALAKRAGQTKLQLPPLLYLSQALYGLGRYRAAFQALDREWPLFEETDADADLGLPGRPLLMATYWSAIAKAEIGEFAKAEALVARVLAADRALLPFEFTYAQTAAGFIAMVKGDYRVALEVSEAALAVAEENDFPFIVPVLATQTGWLLGQTGQAERGLQLAERGVRSALEIGLYAGRSRWCARLAGVALEAGDINTARENAALAKTLAENAGELGYLCSALGALSAVALAAGDLAAARRDGRAALDLARSIRLGPAVAKALVLLGDVEARADDRRAARRSWRQAARWFDQFGMTCWRERVGRRLELV